MSSETYFEYGDEETDWLKSRDPILGAVIDKVGHIYRPVTPDLFSSLANCIVGQQISSKALDTVWGRICERFTPFNPEAIESASIEELQSCGISMRKATYIKEASRAVLDRTLNLSELGDMADEEVCTELCQIKGIGIWTAEMLMTFSLGRKNILSFNDLAIQRGLRMLYRHRKITPALFAKYKRRYAPYNTTAALYLWEISGSSNPKLKDPATPTKR
jgi:DNA-3-methyladenine glycosylase II